MSQNVIHIDDKSDLLNQGRKHVELFFTGLAVQHRISVPRCRSASNSSRFLTHTINATKPLTFVNERNSCRNCMHLHLLYGARANQSGGKRYLIAHFFNTSHQFWLNLQSNYDVQCSEDLGGKVIARIQPLQAAVRHAVIVRSCGSS